jgi:hypothetical protein
LRALTSLLRASAGTNSESLSRVSFFCVSVSSIEVKYHRRLSFLFVGTMAAQLERSPLLHRIEQQLDSSIEFRTKTM